MVSRREMFAGLATIGVGSLGGCLSLAAARTHIEELAVENRRDEAQTLKVLIYDEGEPQFRRLYHLGPRDSDDVGRPSGVVVEDLPPTTAEGTVYAKLDGRTDRSSLDLATVDNDCVRIKIIIPKTERTATIYYTTDCDS